MARELLAKNDRIAAETRGVVARGRIAMWNLIGSPGAGKTALLEAVIRRLRGDVTVSVLEGDQAGDNDARRIESAGAPVVQLNTGRGCHLDASMIERGLAKLAPPRGSFVFVENVGNLVCPALFDLGERGKIVVMSVTEGDDKPTKYPHVFRAARLVVLTKIDLLPYLKFDEMRFSASIRGVVSGALPLVRTSATTATGIDELIRYLRAYAVEGARP
jgi:hydrogenase nickel incorporation protein HypB